MTDRNLSNNNDKVLAIYLFIIYLFTGDRNQIQGLKHVGQMLYHWPTFSTLMLKFLKDKIEILNIQCF